MQPRFLTLIGALMLAACATAPPPTPTSPPPTAAPAAAPTQAAAAEAAPAVTLADWQGIELTDARTGDSFTLGDFTGQTVIVHPMARW